MLDPVSLQVVTALRRTLSSLNDVEAMEQLTKKAREVSFESRRCPLSFGPVDWIGLPGWAWVAYALRAKKEPARHRLRGRPNCSAFGESIVAPPGWGDRFAAEAGAGVEAPFKRRTPTGKSSALVSESRLLSRNSRRYCGQISNLPSLPPYLIRWESGIGSHVFERSCVGSLVGFRGVGKL